MVRTLKQRIFLILATAVVTGALPWHSARLRPASAEASVIETAQGKAAAIDNVQAVVYVPLVTGWTATATTAGQVFHVPFSVGSTGGVRLPEMAVFWFGKVTPTDNGVDVRLGFNNQSLVVDVAVIDRRLWHDNTPDAGSLTEWDAVSLYLDLAGPTGATPSLTAYRLTGQAGSGAGYQRAERGNGVGWAASTVPFTATMYWRGDGFNTNFDDDGWWLQYEIPFASLGLAGRPADGTNWALGVAVHDRDAAPSAPVLNTTWPAAMSSEQPASWGRIAFGLPTAAQTMATPEGSVILRHGLNGVTVPDQHVGGHTTCGNNGASKWTAWGGRVWNGAADDDFANVQNQRDISDWPCFSRYYVSFPLAGHVPATRSIVSATLTLHLTGGSGGDASNRPARSIVQVFTTESAWNSATLSWNTAPLALRNVSRTNVEPHPTSPGWPGIPYIWDLTEAVAAAYANGQPELHLALYSADGAIHSGKYFATSETGDFSAVSRPTLAIGWGTP